MKKSVRRMFAILFCVVLCLAFVGCDVDKTPKNYTVAFLAEGATIPSQLVKENGYAKKPEDPQKEGYVFLGWTLNGINFDFENTKIVKNTALVANWELYVEPIVVPEPFNESGVFEDEDFVAVKGDKLFTNHGNGDEFFIVGTNAGGYLVIEQWMTGFENGRDHKTITGIFEDRFGEEQTLALWENYRENYWSEDDFEICEEMGINTIRLPFTYMTVDPEYNNVAKIDNQTYNFSILEEFIQDASEHGMYTILDLHGAYGSQNGQDHSGEVFDNASQVDFYDNEESKQKTLDMWKAIAFHFKDNPAVVAYDTLNEPGPKGSQMTAKENAFLNQCYEAIRTVDQKHVIIQETCWDGNQMRTMHEAYGADWQNVVYSFHHYTGQTRDSESHLNSMRDRIINDVTNKEFGVPIIMGEFTCYNLEDSWTGTLEILKEYNWSWTTWTFKLGKGSSGWGIIHMDVERIVDPNTFSVDEILECFAQLKTNKDEVAFFTFEDKNEDDNIPPTTLFAVIQQASNSQLGN